MSDNLKLWIVEIHEDDFEYDCFTSGVVWAESSGHAERLIRECRDGMGDGLPRGPETRLNVTLAPDSGVVHTHVTAG